ncbi:hypothetical protein DdX_15489 [Ditylenchus destructor]|uniref:Uncharacterized protein n=1 Tax=Ditylenchus destructor TaxID=166010 RepID=A0AAD4MQ72_9BILA|nr:hypothetical protein DdX_15489 [Ditylenchus destructor]
MSSQSAAINATLDQNEKENEPLKSVSSFLPITKKSGKSKGKKTNVKIPATSQPDLSETRTLYPKLVTNDSSKILALDNNKNGSENSPQFFNNNANYDGNAESNDFVDVNAETQLSDIPSGMVWNQSSKAADYPETFSTQSDDMISYTSTGSDHVTSNQLTEPEFENVKKTGAVEIESVLPEQNESFGIRKSAFPKVHWDQSYNNDSSFSSSIVDYMASPMIQQSAPKPEVNNSQKTAVKPNKTATNFEQKGPGEFTKAMMNATKNEQRRAVEDHFAFFAAVSKRLNENLVAKQLKYIATCAKHSCHLTEAIATKLGLELLNPMKAVAPAVYENYLYPKVEGVILKVERTATKTKNALEQSIVGSCTVFAAVCVYVSGKVIVDLSLNAASSIQSKAKEYAQNMVQKLL